MFSKRAGFNTGMPDKTPPYPNGAHWLNPTYWRQDFEQYGYDLVMSKNLTRGQIRGWMSRARNAIYDKNRPQWNLFFKGFNRAFAELEERKRRLHNDV